MLISTVEELRLYAPANAIDHIEVFSGFFDSSEHDFLSDKLGLSLHRSLTDYYRNLRNSDSGIGTYIHQITDGTDLPPYARLLTVAQRILVFDALSRAIDMQAISINGSGINMSVADDYQKADREAVVAYKATCTKEAHAALNRLLVLLEDWAQDDDANEEQMEIVRLWQESRFFYLAGSLIIPSAKVLQEYLNIYDSREKFISMLPDLRFIQEDVLAPVIGEDFMDFIVTFSQGSVTDITNSEKSLLSRVLHTLRKAASRYLEARTKVIRVENDRRTVAHNEAVSITDKLTEYIALHQSALPSVALDALKSSPLYVEPELPKPETAPLFENNGPSSVIFVTPSLD